jgi:hypothetical protein
MRLVLHAGREVERVGVTGSILGEQLSRLAENAVGFGTVPRRISSITRILIDGQGMAPAGVSNPPM